MDQVAVEVALPGQIEPDVLAVPVAEDGAAAFSKAARVLDERLNGRLRALVESGEASGEVGRTLILHTDRELRAHRVAATGVGRLDEVDADTLRTAAAAVARAAANVGGTLGWLVDEQLPLSTEEQARAIVEGVALASYAPDRWKTEPQDRRTFDRVVVCCDDDPAIEAAAERAARVSSWVNFARDLANAPPNELTPEALGERTAELDLDRLASDILDPARIDELGMGALSAVGRARRNGPRLVVLRYEPEQTAHAEPTLGLVGKAITFDAGGISLKPALNIQDMKGDMSRGAAAITSGRFLCTEDTGVTSTPRSPT